MQHDCVDSSFWTVLVKFHHQYQNTLQFQQGGFCDSFVWDMDSECVSDGNEGINKVAGTFFHLGQIYQEFLHHRIVQKAL